MALEQAVQQRNENTGPAKSKILSLPFHRRSQRPLDWEATRASGRTNLWFEAMVRGVDPAYRGIW